MQKAVRIYPSSGSKLLTPACKTRIKRTMNTVRQALGFPAPLELIHGFDWPVTRRKKDTNFPCSKTINLFLFALAQFTKLVAIW
jgi:hypothetical protein